MNATEIRKLSNEQLVHEELRVERMLNSANFALRTGQLDDTAQLRSLRKDIARLRTVQRERELEDGLASNSLRDQHRASFDPQGTEAAPEEQEAKSGGFLRGIVDRFTGKE